jgi:hypothetical protein
MKKEEIEKRIADISMAIEQSAANHNALLGRLGEARYVLEEMVKKETEGQKLTEEK